MEAAIMMPDLFIILPFRFQMYNVSVNVSNIVSSFQSNTSVYIVAQKTCNVQIYFPWKLGTAKVS